MEIKRIDYDFSICKVEDYSLADLTMEYCFLQKQTKKTQLSASRSMSRKIRLHVITYGKRSEYKAFWIFR